MKHAQFDHIFSGNELEARLFLRDSGYPFCVYVLADPAGVPFYIGEGKLDRPFFHVAEARRGHTIIETNRRKCHKIRQITEVGGQVGYRIDSLHLTKDDAVKREGDMIRDIGRREEGGPLLNLSPGYGNPAMPSPESLASHSATLSGNARDPETASLNSYFKSLWSVESTPIKPYRKWKRNVRHTTGKTKFNDLSHRSASAVVAALHCQGLQLAAGIVFPRLFDCQDIPAIIENGVSEDLIGLGHLELMPAERPSEEAYRIPASLPSKIEGLLGRSRLVEVGVVGELRG